MALRRRILVVDDEPTVRGSCERVFAEQGFDVEAVASGTEGLQRSRTGYFDCALIDLKMPDMDGMELVRYACEERGNMPVVIVTGYGTVETAAEAARLGVSDYVRKPFTPDEIVNAVTRAIERPPRNGASKAAVERLVHEIQALAPAADHFEHRSPQAVAQLVTRVVGVRKANASLFSTAILGVLAGAYIAFGAALATLAGVGAAGKLPFGLSQILVGSVFTVGLMLVVIAGAELFTGNNLMFASVLDKQYGLSRMLHRWALVFLANFLGAVLLAGIMYGSGLWKMDANSLGARALTLANSKANLPFGEAFFRGIGCNWLVCLAVWMALSAREISGKVLAIFFPIMAFVALGMEHSVANMYFVPIGLFLKSTAAATGADYSSLTWGRFLLGNLLPVTLGNIVGGAVFVGSLYWYAYARGEGRKTHG